MHKKCLACVGDHASCRDCQPCMLYPRTILLSLCQLSVCPSVHPSTMLHEYVHRTCVHVRIFLQLHEHAQTCSFLCRCVQRHSEVWQRCQSDGLGSWMALHRRAGDGGGPIFDLYKAWTFLKEGLKQSAQRSCPCPNICHSLLANPWLTPLGSEWAVSTRHSGTHSPEPASNRASPPAEAAFRSNVKYTVVFLYPGALFWVRWRAETQYKCARMC